MSQHDYCEIIETFNLKQRQFLNYFSIFNDQVGFKNFKNISLCHYLLLHNYFTKNNESC